MIIRLAAAICPILVLALVLIPGPARTADFYDGAGHHAALPPADCAPSHPWSFIAPVPVELVIGPGHHYERLAVIPPCTALAVILCEYRTAWCKVRYGRYDGWIFDRSLRFTALRYPFGH